MMKVTVGKTFKELKQLDFDKSPHMIIGGTTRYGKTNLIKVLITELIRKNGENVEFYLFDLKKGVEFGEFANLKQVRGLATDIDEAVELGARMVDSLDKRMRYFKHKGWNNVLECGFKKRTFVLVDEAGEVAPPSYLSKGESKPYTLCQHMFSHIARIGAGFGFRLVMCSQYTTGDVVPREIKQNSNAKICFRIQNGYASEVILDKGNPDAAYLKDIPGRAVFIDGPNKCELQVPLLDRGTMEKELGKYRVKVDKVDKVAGGDWNGETGTQRKGVIELVPTKDS